MDRAAVTFNPERPTANRETGEVTAPATFSAPGEYIVRVQLNDAFTARVARGISVLLDERARESHRQ